MRSGDAAAWTHDAHWGPIFILTHLYTHRGSKNLGKEGFCNTDLRFKVQRLSKNSIMSLFYIFINRSYLRSKVWSEKSSKKTPISLLTNLFYLFWYFGTFFRWQVKVLRPLFEPQQLVLVVKSQPLRHAVILSWWMVACLLYLHYPFKIHRDNLAGEEKMGPRVKRSEK